jgi:hypothetical protein
VKCAVGRVVVCDGCRVACDVGPVVVCDESRRVDPQMARSQPILQSVNPNRGICLASPHHRDLPFGSQSAEVMPSRDTLGSCNRFYTYRIRRATSMPIPQRFRKSAGFEQPRRIPGLYFVGFDGFLACGLSGRPFPGSRTISRGRRKVRIPDECEFAWSRLENGNQKIDRKLTAHKKLD